MMGGVASLLGGTLDLINVVPYAGVAYKAYRGGKIVKSAIRGAEVGIASTSVSEGILQATQETRTAEESAYGIAGGALLGGILGGSVATLSKKQFTDLSNRLEKDLEPKEIITPTKKTEAMNEGEIKIDSNTKIDEFGFIAPKNQNTGAAFNWEANFKQRLKEFSLGGNKVSDAWVNLTYKLNPMTRIFKDPSAQSKETMLKLVRTNLETKGVQEGFAKPQAVETALTRFDQNLGTALNENKKFFAEFSKRVGNKGAKVGMGYKKFNDEVSLAIIDGKHEVPEIEKASKAWIKNVFEPIGLEANDAKLFTKDVKITPDYLTRIYNTPKIIGEEKEFKKLVADKAIERLIPEIKGVFNTKQRNLVSEINDGLARQAELDSLVSKGQKPEIELSDEEIFSLLDRYKQASRDIRNIKPKSLFQFIKENGGIQDSGGELASRDLQKQSVALVRKDQFQKKVVDDSITQVDISMDAVAQRAYEAGYFPEFRERPSVNDLLEKIDEELSGNKVYSEIDLDQVQIKEQAQEFMQELDRQGIDINSLKSRKDVENVLPELVAKERNLQKSKKQRLEARYKKLKDEYEDLFGSIKDSEEIVRFADGTSKTQAQIKEEEFAKEVANSIFDKIRGADASISLPYDLKATVRGAAKERTLNFMTSKELRPYLETDITKIGSRYVRSLGADIEIKKRFGDLNMTEDLAKIKEEYDYLRDQAKTPKEKLKLDKQEKETYKILETFRDLLRGTYQSSRDADSFFTKGMQISRNIQYLSKMGGVTISSLADATMHVFKHGFGRVFGTGVKNLITNSKGIKAVSADNKALGQGFELVLNNRVAALYDIGNQYADRGAFMNFLDASTSAFNQLNLMSFWNNYQKEFAGVVSHQRIIKNVSNFENIKKKEKKYLANLGIDAGNIAEIADQLKKYATKEGDLTAPNLAKWDNKQAKELYINATNLDIDSTIVTKGVGDVPLSMNSEIGKTIGQFRSFAFAANQQVFISGLQRADTAVLSGMISMITAGMLVYYLKTTGAGREVSDDPNVWLVEGVDRSGLMPIVMEMNGLAEAFGVGLGNVVGGQKLSRYASRNSVGSFAGPSFGSAQDIFQVGSAVLSGEITEGDAKALRRNLPAQNLFYIRGLVDDLQDKINNK